MTVSLYRYDTALSDDKDEFEESETKQIIAGSDSCVTATNSISCFGLHLSSKRLANADKTSPLNR